MLKIKMSGWKELIILPPKFFCLTRGINDWTSTTYVDYEENFIEKLRLSLLAEGLLDEENNIYFENQKASYFVLAYKEFFNEELLDLIIVNAIKLFTENANYKDDHLTSTNSDGTTLTYIFDINR